jgi:ATP-dependent Clp protease protease subunit
MFKIGNKDMERVHINGVDRHFYINGIIEDEDDFVDLIDCLYQGKPNENIYIHLNTPGGRLDITMQLLNAIKASEATVVGIADGQVMSAGSIILFACPNISIMPYSYLMMHDGSEGLGGKMNENIKQAIFTQALLKKIYMDVYQPFFSVEEIEGILGGKDMWVSAEDIMQRVQNVVEQAEAVVEAPKRKRKGKNAEEQIQE